MSHTGGQLDDVLEKHFDAVHLDRDKDIGLDSGQTARMFSLQQLEQTSCGSRLGVRVFEHLFHLSTKGDDLLLHQVVYQAWLALELQYPFEGRESLGAAWTPPGTSYL